MKLKNLSEIISLKTEDQMQKIAIIFNERKITYKELNDEINTFAAFLLNKGLKKRDRVMVSSKNHYYTVVACFAILKIGAVEVAIDPEEKNKKKIVNECNAKCVICDFKTIDILYKELNDLLFISINKKNLKKDYFYLKEILEKKSKVIDQPIIQKEDIAFIQYTSGSTGKPKGVVLSHGNFIVVLENNIFVTERKDDKLLLQIPLFHAYGKSILLEYLYAGATIYLFSSFILPTQAFNFIKENRISALEGPPSLYTMLLNFSLFKDESLDHLNYIDIGTSYPSIELLKSIRIAQPQAKICNRYGMTETASIISRLELSKNSSNFNGSCGKLAPYIKMKIIDNQKNNVKKGEVGEIIIKGESLMSGYLNEEPLNDRWFHTGDIGKVDEEGQLHITSRKSLIIKYQGYRISPVEIEEVLMKNKKILECVVIGRKDNLFGEVVRAYLVCTDESNENGIKKFCLQYLPHYKIPKEVIFLKSIPKTTSGKIDKIALSKEEFINYNN